MDSAIRTLIFDIGGTVFDWNSAIVEALARAFPGDLTLQIDRQSFATTCRAKFLDLSGAVMKGDEPWQTSDEMFSRVVRETWREFGENDLSAEAQRTLTRAWRHMPAWPGAREAISSLKTRYVVAPLTILSCTMAVGSSRQSGIEWDLILSCDILGVYKPDPRCYSRASEIVDCKPAEIMMVAAHPSDLRAAMECGYKSAYLVPILEDPGDDYTDTGFESEFDVVARDFGDLATKLM